MSLPCPNLDNRSFQDIVDDVKRQIGLRCPEWSDHNVSDPGVTLVELFAWMMESTLYRLNQVPDRNYIKFLELLGISLESASPARTELCFRLSHPIDDSEDGEAFESELHRLNTLRAFEMAASTVRTETEESIEFVTERDINLVRSRLTHVFSAAGLSGPVDGGSLALRDVREFSPVDPPGTSPAETGAAANAGEQSAVVTGHEIFSTTPSDGDALYLGFESDISSNIIELVAVCNQAAATGLREEYPSQVWEFWNVGEQRWDRIAYSPLDSTYGFNRTGSVELLMPPDMLPFSVNDLTARWVRCRYTITQVDLPPRGAQGITPSVYQRSPQVFTLSARTVGGCAPAANCMIERQEVLGQSDGTAGQVFQLRHAPVLPRGSRETLVVSEDVVPVSESECWTEVANFSESGPGDKHFTVDSLTGEISLGPNISQPDGSAHQYGAVPEKGLTVAFSAYRHGGGVAGNIREGQVRVLKTSIPYISEVWNPFPAIGGRDQELLERAKMRGRASLRVRDRAVTAEDYEFLARQASSAVGRAKCVQPAPQHKPGRKGQAIPPGLVKVLVVPTISGSLEAPRPSDLRAPQSTIDRVTSYLDERRLLTAVLEVGEPDYVFVSTDITIVADPKADGDEVARAVRKRLEQYVNPLTGGPNGDGWPFRRALTLADVYAQVGAVDGVAFLLDARIYRSHVTSRDTGRLSAEERISNLDGLTLTEQELFCTREHRIHVSPIWQVGVAQPEVENG